MSTGWLAFSILGMLILFLSLGLPLVFILGGIAVIGLNLVMGPRSLFIVYCNTLAKTRDFTYITIPLFTYMAYMLERSGAAEDLYTMIQYWAGRLAGSLAIGTVFISTILAAMTGLSSASIITMGVTVLPSMLRRGYDKHLAMGSIAAGSTLGILIPPSVLGLLYSSASGSNIGRMFLAGFLPGFLVAALFILYIGIRCYFKPELGPPLPDSEKISTKMKVNSLWSIVLPGLLVVLVLGSIFFGIATPLESAAVGALGSILIVAINRKLNWKNFQEVNYKTLLLTVMVVWVLIAADSFRALLVVTGIQHLVEKALLSVPFGTWGSIIFMQLILFVLGCFIDEFGIIIITMPAFLPVIRTLGIDPVWFGIIFIINMEMAEMTPPVALNIFYMKAIAPEGTTTEEVYKSVLPFIGMLGIALVAIMLFPQIALWLPNLMIK
ncbi:MAG: TRAP transporter large permease subunit [Chloroflexota bacterium]